MINKELQKRILSSLILIPVSLFFIIKGKTYFACSQVGNSHSYVLRTLIKCIITDFLEFHSFGIEIVSVGFVGMKSIKAT